MSGGSFNYLCHKEADELLHGGHEDAEQMAGALAALGYAEDAAKATIALLVEIREVSARLDRSLDAIRPVWKAMEWWQSCDWGENELKAALADFRRIELPTCSRCGGTGRDPGTRILACQNPGCSRGKDTAVLDAKTEENPNG
jgi:hypothetical protein